MSLIWRQLGSVNQAARVLTQHGLFGQLPVKVSQQAVNDRMHELPADLFELILTQTLPTMHQRFADRTRPLPPQLQKALAHFKRVAVFDGSSLDALIKKCGLLRDTDDSVLAGKMMAVLDVSSRLPLTIWYGEDAEAHDQSWWAELVATLEVGSLSLFDMGFVNYERYALLSAKQCYFCTRAKSNMASQILEVLVNAPTVRDYLIGIGKPGSAQYQQLRLVEVYYEGTWYRYLSNVLDPAVLSGADICWLYRQRWSIETAFKTVKRLLGLAYFHGSSLNAVKLQLWATWLLYSVLMDLTDGVAQ